MSSTEETHSSTAFALDDKPAGITQNKPVSNPYTKNMLTLNIYVDDNVYSFKNLMINI